ncbi:CAAX amino terminal protease family protein [Bacillus sp. JCM 19046]|nr:CAAX amino terminal protease family protein [Bacillus sp. JCM 19045]GAF19680.1 CAAX amino terminal protease family protein [Bacillus sp. JCM 19046]
MSSFLALIVVLLLTCSYKLVSVLVQMFDKKGLRERQRDATIYLWALLVFGIAFVYRYDTVFAWPSNIQKIVPILLVGVFINLLYSNYSGYEPSGKKNILHFVIVFPIIEEMVFRGLILPILNRALPPFFDFELFYLPMTLPIVLSAFLFAVAHLQYYQLNQTSVKYMLFAFSGGIVFAQITELSQSILFALLLHIQFNFFAYYYSSKK